MVDEAHLEALDSGLAPVTDGWFVHCPPVTEHVFVGAGSGPCVILMTGARSGDKRIVYPESELARRHRAGVDATTTSAAEAYAPFPHWQPERPDSWAGLPWG
jgi:uncharacterized cupin superfamily protein